MAACRLRNVEGPLESGSLSSDDSLRDLVDPVILAADQKPSLKVVACLKFKQVLGTSGKGRCLSSNVTMYSLCRNIGVFEPTYASCFARSEVRSSRLGS